MTLGIGFEFVAPMPPASTEYRLMWVTSDGVTHNIYSDRLLALRRVASKLRGPRWTIFYRNPIRGWVILDFGWRPLRGT